MWLIITVAIHLGMLVLLLMRPDLGWLAAVVVVLNHVVLVLCSVWPRSRWLGPNLTRLPRKGGAVAITFDDGPDPETTPAVLRILDQYGAQASFFCVGTCARAHPDVVRDIVAAGHRVENHSDTHPWYFAFLGPQKMAREIASTQADLTALTGASPHYFRAPAGMRNPWLGFVLAQQGLNLVSWTRRGLDSISRDPDRVFARLTRNLEAGDILLLHDVPDKRDRHGRPMVLAVLPRLLERLACEGLRAVALPPPGTLRGTGPAAVLQRMVKS